MISEYFKLSVRNIFNKGIRSWLTMLGIFIGIAAVVSLISLGQGMDDAIRSQFANMGSDTIIVMPGSGFESFGSGKLTRHDETLVRDVRGVDDVAPFAVRLSRIEFKNNVIYSMVIGAPVDDRYKVIEKINTFKILEGRRSNNGEKYTAVVGYTPAHGDFIKNLNVKIGDKLTIEGTDFKVVGVMDKVGNPEDDKNIYVPLDAAKDLFNDPDYNQFIVKTLPSYDTEKVSEEMKSKMRRDRGEKEGEEDFTVQTSDQILESVSGILNTVQAVLVGIALISLMVGGIGIMNTMYTSVLERTREIGVMKAIGAKNSDIMALFLIESGIMGIFGGVVGVIIGLMMSKSVEYVARSSLGNDLLQANTSPWLIFGALAFSFVVGCISGVMPAIQASKLRPVEALRYE